MLVATIGTQSWHEEINAIMSVTVCELQERVGEIHQEQMVDRTLLLFGHFFSPGAG